MSEAQQPPGWYPAEGDPPGTVRWWDGQKWVGGPQVQGAQQQAGYVAPGAGQLANGRELADPWMRIAAAVIDGILTGIVGAIFGGAAAFSSGFGGDNDAFDFSPDGSFIVLATIGAIVIAAYHTAMNTYFSGGVGKLILGLRIVGRDGQEPLGVPLGPKRSANHLVDILAAVPILNILVGIAQGIMNLVSLIFLFTDPEHRTVMDRFADTYVVKKQ
ncbi:MAG: RDD family protein [Acidimicrobiales bacterium]